MAKNVGVIGAMKGKVGNMVFRTRRGMQIASVYQPEVHNPKSARQELSRAKMAMATSVAKGLKLLLRAGWQKTNPTYEVQQFVKRVIPVSAGCFTGTDPEHLTWNFDAVTPGISANLLGSFNGVSQLDFSEEGAVSYSVTPDDALFLDGNGAPIGCGIVVGYYSYDLNQCVVVSHPLVKGEANRFTDRFSDDWSGIQVKVFMFAKQIPNAVNGIQSHTQPWMFPAATTMTRYNQGAIS